MGYKRTPQDRFLKSHATQCAYCGKKFYFGEGKTIDHILPRFYGGGDKVTNKVVCCAECNQAKGKMSVSKFREIVNKENIVAYLEAFKDIQAPTGEHYRNHILKTFDINI